MKINKIIEDLMKEGIPITCRYDSDKGLTYIIDGFYKSDNISIEEDKDGNLIATARYDERTFLKSFEDIIYLNYSWWQKSKDRFDGWKTPDNMWLPLLIKYGYIKEKTITMYE